MATRGQAAGSGATGRWAGRSGSATPTGGPTAAPTGGPTAASTGGATAASTGGATAASTGGATAASTGGATAASTGGPTAASTGGPTAAGPASIAELDGLVSECRACPRLVAWREQVAEEKRAAYRDWTYWGRPVPGFGPADARMLVVGLAPAAHGANRTGRMFTGDRSGDVLYAAMHAVGLASQPTAVRPGDGLELYGVRITAPVHCAPPANKPTTAERDTCRTWLERELDLLSSTLRAVMVLGGFGWQALLPVLAGAGWEIPRPVPKFGHGAHVELAPSVPGPRDRAPLQLHGCYHVSQQNTFTGRLTPAMLERVLSDTARSAGL